ncbi:hypothetical protein FHU41_002128 [Psychromicrobium silvestre]|uniref:ORC1/DEAH AAA+ ATPase domain-containing protein n=1 Tax=Psychromicrobium silvestre TaxID=1645614 RepID=A0A7Y9LUJ5_9MICC|nr:ATP-binding protein [Psychromicrobium silvestre]NYE95878.1 hypothetical protein [Psychromicrobium silvestre]
MGNQWAAWLEDNSERQINLAHQRGWFAFAEAADRVPVKLLTASQLRKLGEEEREDYDECRQVWNVNFPTIKTPQLLRAFEVMDEVFYSSARDGHRLKGGVAIDAPPGLGKTTIVTQYGRGLHRRDIRRHGARTTAGHQRIPIAFVSLTASMTLKTLNRKIVEFYGHPAIDKVTSARLADLAVNFVESCQTRAIVVDDLHFIDFRQRSGVEVSDHLKWLANALPVVFIFTGVGLAKKAFFNEGRTSEEASLAQTARRTTLHTVAPFLTNTDAGARAWVELLSTIEAHLLLVNRKPGMLTDHAELIAQRTQGHIASLAALVDRACHRAIRSGEETISEKTLQLVTLDNAASRSSASA